MTSTYRPSLFSETSPTSQDDLARSEILRISNQMDDVWQHTIACLPGLSQKSNEEKDHRSKMQRDLESLSKVAQAMATFETDLQEERDKFQRWKAGRSAEKNEWEDEKRDMEGTILKLREKLAGLTEKLEEKQREEPGLRNRFEDPVTLEVLHRTQVELADVSAKYTRLKGLYDEAHHKSWKWQHQAAALDRVIREQQLEMKAMMEKDDRRGDEGGQRENGRVSGKEGPRPDSAQL